MIVGWGQETRALAIACFYALGTATGGGTSPLLFGWLIEFWFGLAREFWIRNRRPVPAYRDRDRI